MITLLLALAAAQAAPAPAAEADDAIVVTARRAREFRYRIGFDRKTKRLICRVLQTTGDKPLDRLLCESARSCVPAGVDPLSQPTEPQLAATRTCLNTGGNTAIATRAAQLRTERPKS